MEGFKWEWEQKLPLLQSKKLVSIYFGGGTPALLGASSISTILSWIKNASFDLADVEITLEANPENITASLMREYAEAGINRMSMGIQSLDDTLLHRLNRLHSGAKALNAVYEMAEAGISNISIDLMYDLPGQTLPLWMDTLEKACTLPITHLSLYNLTIEPHTAFYKYRQQIQKQLPDDETSLEMYKTAIHNLGLHGLKQYEISAFAKPNRTSKHNVGYWTSRPFLGLGPSAFSDWDGKRFRNVAHLHRYHAALEKSETPMDFEEKLDVDARRRERLAIQLRILSGINLLDFEKEHGPLERETNKILQTLQNQGLISKTDSLLQLTKKGILFYDTVATEII